MTNEEKLLKFRFEVLNLLQIKSPTIKKVQAGTVLEFDSLTWTETSIIIEELFPIQISVSELRRLETYGQLETDIIRRLMELA